MNTKIKPYLDSFPFRLGTIFVAALSPSKRLVMGKHIKLMAIHAFNEQIIIANYLQWIKPFENV